MSDIPHPWIDQSFNEPMVLFHNIIEVLDGTEFSSFAQSLICFEFIKCRGIGRILIHIYDSRRLVMRRLSLPCGRIVLPRVHLFWHERMKSRVLPTDIHCPVQIFPLALDFNISFVNAP
jgi:hypothetical protein